jgi:hypothetical protein
MAERIVMDLSTDVLAVVALSAAEAAALVPTSPTADDLRTHAAARRYAVETGGLVVGDATIDTSRSSQSMIAGAVGYMQASGAASVEFKAASGWTTLSADEILNIALAVAAHVQRCFAAERAVDEAIAAGSVTTYAQIDAMIEV